MQQYFPCHRCGTHNVVGAASCSHCRQQLYYNCPHCGAWVDNRYPHCPSCRRALSWPRTTGPDYIYGQTWYVPQHSYVEEKKGNPWPVILVSLFIIGVVALIFLNPGSSSATRNDITTASLQTTQMSSSPSGSQPQITASSPNGQASSSAAPVSSDVQNTSSGNSSYLPAGVKLTTSSGEVVEIEISPITSTSNTGYTPKKSTYLQQLWPTWGHCTKGSCQAYTQQ